MFEGLSHAKKLANQQLLELTARFRLDLVDLVLIALIAFVIGRFLWKNFNRFLQKQFYINIKRRFVQAFLSLPFVAAKIEKELEKTTLKVREDFRKGNPLSITRVLPEDGDSWDNIDEKLKIMHKEEIVQKNLGRLSGCYYTDPKDSFEKDIYQRAAPYLYYNLLHVDKCLGVRQAEAELISFFIDMLKGGENAMGASSCGGTESILLAILSFRVVGKQRGITQPELLVPASAHSAFYKACDYFAIKARTVPLDPKTQLVDLRKLKAFINSNTIGVVCSAGNYPHGLVDPIPEVAKIVRPYKLPIHVDCCLGGYSMLFAEDLGIPVPKFSFEIPEVATISIDPHKYGMAPKGVSLVLFRDPEFKKASIFVQEDWVGGVYGTPCITGSKPSSSLVGAWMATVKLGKKGLRENVRKIHQVLRKTVDGLKAIPSVAIMGDPQLNTFAFKLEDSFTKFSIFQVAEGMIQRGWYAPVIQRPSAIHFAITLCNIENVEKNFVADVRSVFADLESNPQLFEDTKSSQIYCSKLKVPDGSVLNNALKNVIAEFSVA